MEELVEQKSTSKLWLIIFIIIALIVVIIFYSRSKKKEPIITKKIQKPIEVEDSFDDEVEVELTLALLDINGIQIPYGQWREQDLLDAQVPSQVIKNTIALRQALLKQNIIDAEIYRLLNTQTAGLNSIGTMQAITTTYNALYSNDNDREFALIYLLEKAPYDRFRELINKIYSVIQHG